MNTQTKQCQNCKKEFLIEPEDFTFYEKMNLPPPTWCPECRLIRRMIWRNERILYKRKCDLCGKDIIAIHSKDSPIPVYCNSCWYSDNWDVTSYAQDYNFDKPFLEQLKELKLKVPRVALYQKANVNCHWVNREENSKNCYLTVGGIQNENTAYDTYSVRSKDTFDNLLTLMGQFCYQNIFGLNLYKTFFSQFCFDCQETYFSFNCRNCSNIVGCANLNNKSYQIFNKPVTKEQYKEFFKEHNLGKQSNIDYLKQESRKVRLSLPHKYNLSVMAINCTGDFIEKSKNCHYCFNALETEDCKYIYVSGRVSDCFDTSSIGLNSQLCYEFISGGGNSSRVFFSHNCGESQDLFYCMDIDNSHDLFGCIGLRNKQYCILNKQYTKEEYNKLLAKIIEHMNSMPYVDKKGRIYKYGEFLPSEMSPFSYNETVAQEYFPLTKEQILEQGYSWKDSEDRDINIDIRTESIPDDIKDVKDDIIGKVIECKHQGRCNEQCTYAFKIIPKELEFYRKMNIALPRLCPNCRHFQRIRQRNPLKLWHRKCQCKGEKSVNDVYNNTIEHFHKDKPCPNEFETPYSPDRPEIVYCEECYKREVI